MIQAGRRAKTILATSTHVELGVFDRRVLLRRHAIEEAGTVLLRLEDIPPRCAQRVLEAGSPEAPWLDLVATDVTSVARPDRIRGIVRMTGRLERYDGPMSDHLAAHFGLDDAGNVGGSRPRIARFVALRIGLEWRVETTDCRAVHVGIDPDVYAAARVDSLGGWEDGWMAHLDAHHRDSIRALVERILPLPAGADARPVIADELGMVVRVTQGRCVRDLRVPFGRSVGCGCEAVEALNSLVTA